MFYIDIYMLKPPQWFTFILTHCKMYNVYKGFVLNKSQRDLLTSNKHSDKIRWFFSLIYENEWMIYDIK